jgi:hypothetical protein
MNASQMISYRYYLPRYEHIIDEFSGEHQNEEVFSNYDR